MLFGDNQEMNRRSRVNVFKGDHFVIFINFLGRDPVSYTHLDVYKRQAHDLANAQENSIAVRFSEAGDLFRPMGTLTDEAVPEGELVYVSGHQVKTRRFIWRQSDDGKITNLTTEYLIPLDSFIGTNDDDVIKARDEFASLLTEWFGASVSTGFVSKENNIFNF